MNQLLLMLEIIGAVVVIYFLTPIIIALFLGAFCPLYQIVEKIYNCMAGLLYPWRWYKQNQKRNEPMKTVIIYTDGACSGNPGPGGWGAILMYGDYKKELSGGEAQTTNNRMELTGVISALEALKQPCIVELYSDSKYVIDALSKGWAKGWRARNWVKPDKKPALNPDLWARLLELYEYHTVNLHWVKGHADNPYNNRCDELAVAESQKYR